MNRSWMPRWLILPAALATLLLVTSGCTTGVQPTSWTGLTVADGVVYAADLTQVVALNAADGQPVWTFPQNPQDQNEYRGLFQVTPAVGDGYVIVASHIPARGFFSLPQNIVWALHSGTGELAWSFAGAHGPYFEGGDIGGGMFVIGNNDGNVYALDLESGQLEWQFRTGHRVWAAPLIISDTVYIGSLDRHLYALHLSDGTEIWRFPADGNVADGAFASAPVLWDDTFFIGAFDDRLYALDANTGTERWHFAGQNWFWGSPAVYSDTVYAADVNGNVYAINAETGEQVWSKQLLNDKGKRVQVRAGPALSEDGETLLVCSQDGTLYALDTTDGFVLWTVKGDGQALSTPVVSGSLAYVTFIYGKERIKAVHVDTGRVMWAYPHTEEE